MILTWLILIPLIAGIVAWVVARREPQWSRWVCLAALALELLILIGLWIRYPGQVEIGENARWMLETQAEWIPQFGISYYLAMDGLSLVLLLLSAFLGIISVAVSWREIEEHVGFFHFNLMWVLAGIIGVFLAMDMFLFYFFWELMLVPMYFLIAIWGHENRRYAAIKFFLFTQAGGLLMLLSILGLYFAHGNATGEYTFNYTKLLGHSIGGSLAFWLMLGYFIAFAVKLPAIPVHTWLPDAHTEAPTAGSVILAGLLLKTGAYGLLRFVVPLFPESSMALAPAAMILGIVGIVYGAVMAFAQSDMKRLVAYTSVSHMGFVLLGVFAFTQLALQGVVIEIVCHGISTGALFILVGFIYERIHTRDMNRMGGMWRAIPRIGGVGMLYAMASLGLPGLGNFIGEFLILLGTYQASVIMAVLAAPGLVFAVVYALYMIQRVFQGSEPQRWDLRDITFREGAVMAAMIAVILWIGVYPQPVLNTSRESMRMVRQYVMPQSSTSETTESSIFYLVENRHEPR